MITQERLRELFLFHSETGILYWRVHRGRAVPGDIAGRLSKKTGYREIRIDRKEYLAHRLVWLWEHGEWPKGGLDHRNTNRDDNRPSNLRLATAVQNNANRVVSRKSKSGLKGVYFTNNKWAAYIRVNGKGSTIGYFPTKEIASAAYFDRARQAFGEFARAK
jgi:hypothetical protein